MIDKLINHGIFENKVDFRGETKKLISFIDKP